jgi:hypothetical protein
MAFFQEKKTDSAVSVADPGCLSRSPNPDPGFYIKRGAKLNLLSFLLLTLFSGASINHVQFHTQLTEQGFTNATLEGGGLCPFSRYLGTISLWYNADYFLHKINTWYITAVTRYL